MFQESVDPSVRRRLPACTPQIDADLPGSPDQTVEVVSHKPGDKAR
jgi:hypothetical protein